MLVRLHTAVVTAVLAAFVLIASGPGATAQTRISVFEVQNNTGATLKIDAIREEHGTSIAPVEIPPYSRRLIRLDLGIWQITATPVRMRGVGAVTRRFNLPDEGPYGIALAPGDFGQVRMEDGPYATIDPELDTAEAAGLPRAADRGVPIEFPPRGTHCERDYDDRVNPYFALIPRLEECSLDWTFSGFDDQTGLRACRICPDRTSWDSHSLCCKID